MIVKAKSTKQLKELKRQDEPGAGYTWYPSIHDGFEPEKNQKEKSALKKSYSMIVKAKSAKQLKELKRQDEPGWSNYELPSIHDGFELEKNQKEKSALKKSESMIVKAKSTKQLKELKRQNSWLDLSPSIHDGFELEKNQKDKSALKKSDSMIVKAKSANQFNSSEIGKRQEITACGDELVDLVRFTCQSLGGLYNGDIDHDG